jgi:hypothetical protein
MQISTGRDHVVRILDSPELFHIHWVKKVDYDDRERFSLQKCAEPAECDLCEQGVKQTIRCRTNVLDKGDNKVKQVEFGAMIYNQIMQHAMNLGDPSTYDITIRRRRQRFGGGSTYTVTPSPPSVLDIDSQTSVNLFMQEEVPIGRLVLDIDVCPHCDIMGALRDNKCQCPRCGHIIWADS